MNKNMWIIAICNTDGDGIDIETVIGTDDEIKEYMINRLNQFQDEDKDNFDYGSERVNEVISTNSNNNEFYAYSVYSNYHIDCTAVRVISLTTKNL